MDVEFSVHDTFALTRPQWKLATSLEEASKAFQLAITQDQKMAGADKTAELDEATSGSSSDDDNGDADELEGDGEEESASEEEEVEVCKASSMFGLHLLIWFMNRTLTKIQLRIAISMRTRRLSSHVKRKLLTLKTRLNLSESMPR